MKSLIALCLFAATATGFAQPVNQGAPPVNVRVVSEAEELAQGYAAAFPAIARTPVYLIHSRDDTTTVLIAIKSVKALSGVLIVQDEKGLTYVINPHDVVMITDAPPKKDS